METQAHDPLTWASVGALITALLVAYGKWSSSQSQAQEPTPAQEELAKEGIEKVGEGDDPDGGPVTQGQGEDNSH